MREKMRKSQGFTLIELLVVIAILAILASVTVVGYSKFMDKANLQSDNEEISQVNRALDYYLVDNDLDITSLESINEALKIATDNTFDLDTYELRSRKKGYNLYFDTDLLELSIVKDYQDLVKAGKMKKNAMHDNLGFSSAAAFLWSPTTPYLMVSKAGNPLADVVGGLRGDATDFDLKGIDEEFKNELVKNAYVNDNGSLIDLAISPKSAKTSKANLFFSDKVETINTIGNYEFKELTLPKTIKKVNKGAFFNASIEKVNLNHEVKIHANAFNNETVLSVSADLDLQKTFSFSSSETKIVQNDEIYLLKDNNITTPKGDILKTEVVEEDLTDVLYFKNEVLKTSEALKANNLYNIFDYSNKIKELNELFASFEDWELEALKGTFVKAYEAYTNETLNSNGLVILTEKTGLKERFETYQAIEKLILNSEVLINKGEIEIGESDVDLVEMLNGVLEGNETYQVRFSTFKTATDLLVPNVFEVKVLGNILDDNLDGTLTNLEVPGKATVTLSSYLDHQTLTFSFQTEHGITGLTVLNPQILDKALTIGKNSPFVMGLTVGGLMDQPLTNKDFKVVINGTTLETEVISLDNSNLNYVLKILNLNVLNSGEATLEISLRNYHTETRISLVDGFNVIDGNTFLKTYKNTNVSYNVDLVFNSGKDGYQIVDGRLVSYSTSNSVHAKASYSNANVYANNTKIDMSLVTDTNGGSNKTIINLDNSTIRDLDSKLKDPNNYSPSAEFNLGAAHIYVTGNSNVFDSRFRGGSRGLRIRPENTLVENLSFEAVVVPVEIYADGSTPNHKVNLTVNNVKISSTIPGNNNLKNGMAILYFPGGKGAGIKNFDKVNLTVNNLEYDGSFDHKEATKVIRTVLGGLNETLGDLSSLLVSLDIDVKNAFKRTGQERISLKVIMPTLLHVWPAIPKNEFNNLGAYKPTFNQEFKILDIEYRVGYKYGFRFYYM